MATQESLMVIMAQVAPAAPLDRIHGIRDRFSTGGSTQGFILVLLAMAGLFVLLYALARMLRRLRRRQTDNPRKLFHEVIRHLPLTIPQRELLRRIARDLGLEHPTVILLSPQIFHTHANQWMAATRNANATTRERLTALAQTLYARPPQ